MRGPDCGCKGQGNEPIRHLIQFKLAKFVLASLNQRVLGNGNIHQFEHFVDFAFNIFRVFGQRHDLGI
jgi:hypothetical protein